LKPIVNNLYVGYVPCPFGTIDITLVSVVQVVIAGNKVKAIKRLAQFFQTPETVLQGLHVQRRTLMTPVAQEHAGFTTVLLGRVYKPINKITTVLIVDKTVGL
jgi:hypothetical protein